MRILRAMSGRINLYRTISVSHNNYTLWQRSPQATWRPHFDQHCPTPQIVMALFRYFQPTTSLPTTKEMALGDTVTQSANVAILRKVQAKRSGECKTYTAFAAEQRATIGKYASEYGKAAAVKKFKADFEVCQLDERTVCCFKECYSLQKIIFKVYTWYLTDRKRINKNCIYLLRGEIFKNRIINFSHSYNCTVMVCCLPIKQDISHYMCLPEISSCPPALPPACH